MSKLGVAIQGAGWVSAEHIRAYNQNPHTEVRAICSRRLETAEQRRAEFGIDCDVTTDFGSLLTRDDVDILSICTPNYRHAEETVAAADAGKHILIEKPVALNLEDLRSSRDAVRKAGVKTVVSFVLHWNPYFQTAKALLDDGAIGKIIYAETGYFHEIGPWYPGYHWGRKTDTGGSTMLMGGTHALDAIRWFTGEVGQVCAFSTRGHRDDYEYDPTSVAILQFTNGAVGHVAASFEIDSPYVFPVNLMGTEGAIRDDRVWSKRKFPGQTDWVSIPTVMPDSGSVEDHPFQGEIDHLVDCIRNDVESEVNLEDAVHTHEAALAIDMSAREGRCVSLPLLDD